MEVVMAVDTSQELPGFPIVPRQHDEQTQGRDLREIARRSIPPSCPAIAGSKLQALNVNAQLVSSEARNSAILSAILSGLAAAVIITFIIIACVCPPLVAALGGVGLTLLTIGGPVLGAFALFLVYDCISNSIKAVRHLIKPNEWIEETNTRVQRAATARLFVQG
jgi:hypothetical protein